MQNFIITVMNQFGYIGILLLITIENVFPPIPSEIILTFGGFMCSLSELYVLGVIFFATAGSMFGAILLYMCGYYIKTERLLMFVRGKWGSYLHMKEEHIKKAQTWFDRCGKKAVLFGRFIPVVRSMISIPAGLVRMPLIPFLLYTTLGSFLWNSVLVCGGYLAGNHWESLVKYVENYSYVLLIISILVCLYVIVLKYRKKKTTN